MQTIIIPTQNRHHYFKKIFSYYESWGIRVLLVDSSCDCFSDKIPYFISYMHTPGLSFTEKLLKALQTVTSDFVTLCADDDFLIEKSARDSFNFLRKNKEYVAYTGKYIWFSNINKSFKIYDLNPPKTCDRLMNQNGELSSLLRVKEYLSNYHQILWSTFHKQYLLQFFEAISQISLHNDNFIEITMAIFLCAKGCIFVDQNFWSIRERTQFDHWGAQQEQLAQYVNFRKEYSAIREIFKESIDEHLMDTGFDVYLDTHKITVERGLQNIKNIISHRFFKKFFFNRSIIKAKEIHEFYSLVDF